MMPMISPDHKIAYFPVPKAACTSLKLAMYALTNGHDYDKAANGGKAIQQSFRTQNFVGSDLAGLDGFFKIAVVRDPVSRIISAYTNKIEKWGQRMGKRMSDPKIVQAVAADHILPEPPSLIEFCLRLGHYRRHFKSIRHHTNSFATFLGPDLGYFNRVYRMEELDVLCADLLAQTGTVFALPHANPSAPVDRTMNAAATAALLAYCAPDYAYLAEYYTAPAPADASSQRSPVAAL